MGRWKSLPRREPFLDSDGFRKHYSTRLGKRRVKRNGDEEKSSEYKFAYRDHLNPQLLQRLARKNESLNFFFLLFRFLRSFVRSFVRSRERERQEDSLGEREAGSLLNILSRGREINNNLYK